MRYRGNGTGGFGFSIRRRRACGALLVLLGLAALGWCALHTQPWLGRAHGYRSAPACTAGQSVRADADCLTRVPSRVVDRYTRTSYTPPSCTTSYDSTTHTSTTTCTGGSTSTDDYVVVTVPGGGTESFKTGDDVYRAAVPHRAAELVYWRHAVVTLTVGGRTEKFFPAPTVVLALVWTAGFAGAGALGTGVFLLRSRVWISAALLGGLAVGWVLLGFFTSLVAAWTVTFGPGPVALPVLGAVWLAVLVICLVNWIGDR